jgi:F-type H+-transporting ATPase subunit b
MFSRCTSALLVGLAAIACAAAAPGAEDPPARAGKSSGHAAAAKAPEAPSHDAEGKQSEGGHGEKTKIDPLFFEKDLALWTGAVFLVFFFILWKFAWKPIAAGLDERERHVSDQILQAQANNEEARRLLAEYHQKLAASEAEVREILEQGRREAERLGQQIFQKAKEGTDLEKQRALREIEVATAGAIKELAEKSATLAVELAGKLVRAELDPKAHVRLIEQAVADFAKMAPSRN